MVAFITLMEGLMKYVTGILDAIRKLIERVRANFKSEEASA